MATLYYDGDKTLIKQQSTVAAATAQLRQQQQLAITIEVETCLQCSGGEGLGNSCSDCIKDPSIAAKR